MSDDDDRDTFHARAGRFIVPYVPAFVIGFVCGSIYPLVAGLCH